MTNERKAEIFDEMIWYLIETVGQWETVWQLSQYGMTKEEISSIIANHYLTERGN